MIIEQNSCPRCANARTVRVRPALSMCWKCKLQWSPVTSQSSAEASVTPQLDPPDHTRLRGLVSQAFTPRAIERLRHQIQNGVEALLDHVQPAGRMDLIADFAYPLPVQVICAVLCVPLEHERPFRQWSAAIGVSLDAVVRRDAELIRAGNAATAGLTEYSGV